MLFGVVPCCFYITRLIFSQRRRSVHSMFGGIPDDFSMYSVLPKQSFLQFSLKSSPNTKSLRTGLGASGALQFTVVDVFVCYLDFVEESLS